MFVEPDVEFGLFNVEFNVELLSFTDIAPELRRSPVIGIYCMIRIRIAEKLRSCCANSKLLTATLLLLGIN